MSPSFEWADRLPTLSAERVALRWLREEDAPALFSVFGDPVVMRYWSTPPHRDLAASLDYIRDIHGLFRSRLLFQWGIALRSDDAAIGTCTLFHMDPKHRRAELGFALGRAHWGRGLASEALSRIVGFAFDALDLHRLEADADPRNDRSIRLLERHGFRREGLLRERYQVNGEIQDALYFGLLRPEWRARGA